MKEGPDISRIGALIGDPARANMLAALMDGRALTARELAEVAGVTPQTASAHLGKLEDGGLVQQDKQGRHRYFALSDAKVAGLMELMMQLAADQGHMRKRPGPKDEALRHARVCYDHLAGAMGVQMLDRMVGAGHLAKHGKALELTLSGRALLAKAGVALPEPGQSRRPLCRTCLDWSERRDHLAGAVGAALFQYMLDAHWALREADSRVVRFTPKGESAFAALFDA